MSQSTDTIPRVSARDLLITVSLLGKGGGESTLENVRLRLCLDRKVHRKGSYLWSRARDASQELRRLGLIDIRALPRDAKGYGDFVKERIRLTPDGMAFFNYLHSDRAGAYDQLFSLLHLHHPYLRSFVRIICERELHIPVLTSYKDHVGEHYRAAEALVEAVSHGQFMVEPLLEKLAMRSVEPIPTDVLEGIRVSVRDTAEAAQKAATQEESTEFAKKFLHQLNEAVIPSILAALGIGFDYRSLRIIWQLGGEFQTWWDTSFHPAENGVLVFRTAEMDIDGKRVIRLDHSNGLENIGANFLERLYGAYQVIRSITGLTYTESWGLRAVFCYENRCPPVVFETLLDRHYIGDHTYQVQLEIERKRPRHVRPLVIGKRRIGAISVTRKTSR